MATVRSYKDLIAWQKSMHLAALTYEYTQSFPKREGYGLTSQMRRAAVSIPSNIAEGQGKSSTGEFRVAIGHAKGSLFELETQILLARRFEYLNEACSAELLDNVDQLGRLLNGLLNSLEAKRTATSH